eukprot:TRINITY_DN20915_c0_g1_i1.p2 TRINITY_DN20915_c0_g1~~TRINITY_DN20915_c0_g1_i1.p2  ORF type:complete len:469 (+),score=196.32 TRINITY_DN20915_c0_g1_i1:51-1409(+)
MVNHRLELYMTICKDVQVAPDPAVIATLRTNSEHLEVSRSKGSVAEGRWLALVSMLVSRPETETHQGHLRHFPRARSPSVGPTGHVKEMHPIRYLDVTGYGVAGYNGGNLLETLLTVNNSIEELNLCTSRIDTRSAEALGRALHHNTTLRSLQLEDNPLNYEGAAALAKALISAKDVTQLQVLDLNNTNSTFTGVQEIINAVKEVNAARDARGTAESLIAYADRNFTREEIANSISHGFAVLLALFGASLLLPKAYRRSERDGLACTVFILSMLTCYISSTLYHSMFMLKRVQIVFRILDHSAIYLLIAGTYTPIVLINFDDVEYAHYLLVLQWVVSFIGIVTKGLDSEHAELKPYELILFAVMGWSALFLGPQLLTQEPYFRNAVFLGGIMYTCGIFFFVRGDVWPMYHAVWHLFTMAGGLCHFLAIYHTIRFAPIPGMDGQVASATCPPL